MNIERNIKMKKTIIITVTMFMLIMICPQSKFTANAEVLYSCGKYETPKELIEAADYVFEGILTGIHFEILDLNTGLPLDIDNPPEGLDQLVYDSQDYPNTYRLDTVYEISVTNVYKGEIGEQVDFYFDWGLRDFREDEQRQLLMDFGFKLQDPETFCAQYIYITNYDYGSHISIGDNYLFFGKNAKGNRIRMIDYCFFAFGVDYPYTGSNRPINFMEMFNYKNLINYLHGNDPHGDGNFPGDIDGDRMITITDYLIMKHMILGIYDFNPQYTENADINKDGSIDATDIMLLKRHILGIEKIVTNDQTGLEADHIICRVLGHIYSSEIVTVITHRARDTQPRCLEKTLKINTCQRCGYVESDLISRTFIFCDE